MCDHGGRKGEAVRRAETRPRRLACLASAAVLAASVALPLLAPGRAAAVARAHLVLTALEEGTLQQINAIRTAHGLAPLRFDPTLLAAATAHSMLMTETGTFSHLGPHGESFSARIGRYLPITDEAGENLLWGRGAFDSSAIVGAWMRSPEHRANLLRPEWREIGLSARTLRWAPGVYGDAPVTVVVADFDVHS